MQDPQGDSAGRIRDLVINVEDGKIAEASIGVGGFFGIREKLASVDWQSLSFPAGEDFARINMSSDQLKGVAYSKDEYWERLGFAGEQPTDELRREQDRLRQERDLMKKDQDRLHKDRMEHPEGTTTPQPPAGGTQY